jgi:hypothetical protein
MRTVRTLHARIERYYELNVLGSYEGKPSVDDQFLAFIDLMSKNLESTPKALFNRDTSLEPSLPQIII